MHLLCPRWEGDSTLLKVPGKYFGRLIIQEKVVNKPDIAHKRCH